MAFMLVVFCIDEDTTLTMGQLFIYKDRKYKMAFMLVVFCIDEDTTLTMGQLFII